jgi:L-malate glycosyltransferase
MSERVLQVVLSLSPGGTERLVIELSRRLRGQHGMSVCCLDEPGAWAGELTSESISVTALRRRPGFAPEIGRRIADVARQEGATILHCHHYSPFIYGMIARWWHPAHVIFTEHGRLHDGPPSPKRKLANRLFARMPAEVYAVSEDLRRHMIAEGFPGNRIRVVYNGIEIRRSPTEDDRRRARLALGLVPSDLVVGAVGRLDPVKDLPTLLSAFLRTVSELPNARLLLIGDGPERDHLQQLIDRDSLRDCVRLTGYRSDVRDLLPALDVYVNTSVFEGVSLTVLEAMASALPVVATRVGGTPEVVVDGMSGVLVEPRDPESVHAAVAALLRNGSRRRALGMAARVRVQSAFSIERMVEEYAAAYRGQRTLCVA